MTGGRHALEETWCSMSTLLQSLQIIQWQTRRSLESNPAALLQHIPVDACVLSPQVEIFRETSAKGYAFTASPTKLCGVCSVAMFNMNPRVSDSPLDAPADFAEYCQQVRQKFQGMLVAAKELNASVLVVPDVGCGVFENDPEVVGSLLGESIREFSGDIEVVTTGKPAFHDAAKLAAEAPASEPLRETLAPPPSFARTLKPTRYGARADHAASISSGKVLSSGVDAAILVEVEDPAKSSTPAKVLPDAEAKASMTGGAPAKYGVSLPAKAEAPAKAAGSVPAKAAASVPAAVPAKPAGGAPAKAKAPKK